jgi:hypothetical protein
MRRPSQKKRTERNTYRIEHQMWGKALQSLSVAPLLPNDGIPSFWMVHDTRQVSRTVELLMRRVTEAIESWYQTVTTA